MAESNKPSNPKRDQKETDKSSQNRNERVENSSEKRRDDGTAKRKTVLAKPAPVDDLNDAKSAKLVAPKKHAINVKLIDDEIEAEGDITAERRKPTRVDNEIPASLRDANDMSSSSTGNPKSDAAHNSGLNRSLSNLSGANVAQKRPLPNPSGTNKVQSRPLPNPSGANPAQSRPLPNPSGLNQAQNRGLVSDGRGSSGIPNIPPTKAKTRSIDDNDKCGIPGITSPKSQDNIVDKNRSSIPSIASPKSQEIVVDKNRSSILGIASPKSQEIVVDKNRSSIPGIASPKSQEIVVDKNRSSIPSIASPKSQENVVDKNYSNILGLASVKSLGSRDNNISNIPGLARASARKAPPVLPLTSKKVPESAPSDPNPTPCGSVAPKIKPPSRTPSEPSSLPTGADAPNSGAVVEVGQSCRIAGEEENTKKRRNPTISSDSGMPPAAVPTEQRPLDEDGMPLQWSAPPSQSENRETFFSAPQTFPEPDESDVGTARHSDNVHLERHESLPDELEDIIAGYDDEITHMRTRDGARECSIQLCIARILEHTRYEKLAYVRYLKALEANHVSQTAIHELRRIARAYNKPKDVVTLLQSALDSTSSPEEQAILLEECGLIVYFSGPTQRDDGIAMLCRAVALAPKRISAHLTLLQLFLFEGRFDDCCEILEKLVSLTDDRQAKIVCHTLLADIQSSLDPGKAAGLNEYLQVLSLDPGSLYAYQHAMGVLLRQKSYHSFYEHCISFAQATKDKASSHTVFVLAGAVAFDLLSDSEGAISALNQAIKCRPNDKLPLELLLEYYALDPAKWRECDKILEDLLKFAQSPKERNELMLMRALNADINGHAQSLACDYLRTIYNEGVTDPIILDYYCFLLRVTDAIPEAMAVRKSTIEQAHSEEGASRFAHLGCFCYDELKKIDDAEACFRSALALDPDQRIAFEYLETILRARNDYNGLVQIYLARLDVVLDARLRASILHTLATIFHYNLGQYENAIIYYNQYLEIFPDDVHVLHCLEQIYMSTRNWNKLIDVYVAEKNTLTSPSARRDLLMRMASVCSYKLNKPNYAFKFLMQAKDETPNFVGIYRDLLRILNQTQDWKTYVIIAKDLVDTLKKPEEKIVVLFNAATVYEYKLCDTRSAIACYETILDLSPNHSIAYTKLATIYQTTNDKVAYYELAIRRAQGLQQPADRARTLFKVALKTYTQFADIDRAISILEMAIAADKTHLPTVVLLAMLYAATARIEPLINMLQDYTNTARDQITKSTCAMTIAYLRTWILKSPQDAIHPLELALALSPEATSVAYMLILAQYRRGLYAELPPLFTERAQNTSDRDFAVFFYNMAAFIAHQFPTQPDVSDGEIAALKSALALDPDNIIANERLEAMEPCRANLVPFLEKRLNYALPEDKTELKLAIAETIYNAQPQKAFSMVCKIVEDNPSHLPAIRIATNMAAKLNNDNLYCRFMALQAQNLENIAMRIIAWTNAGKVAEEKLHQTDTAIEYYKQAFMLAPQQMELCDQLVNLLRKKRDSAAIDGIMQIHTRSISRENQAMRYLEMADIYLKEFNNPTQAAIKLRQILEIEPDNYDVLQKLANIEVQERHFADAKNTLEILVGLDNVPPAKLVDARKQLAALYIHKLNRPEAALPLLEQVLKASPDDVNAIENMADLYIAQSKYQEALALLLRLNSKVKPPKNVKILLQMATIYQYLEQSEKIPNLMRQIAEGVKYSAKTLDNVAKWLSYNHQPAITLAFVEKILEIQDVTDELRIAIYEFASRAYAGPLHMRFEADKYAIAAAKLAPNSFKTQLMAAHVFSPKDAMHFATAAARLSPFIPDAYRVMLDIATNAGRNDLQARVEQTLEVLDPQFQPNRSLQKSYIQRAPKQHGIMSPEAIYSVSPVDINYNIQRLLSMSEEYAQIFDFPQFDMMPASAYPDIVQMASEIATAMGTILPEINFCQCDKFVFSKPPHMRNTLLLNIRALEKASEREQRFHLASALLHTKLGTMPFVILPSTNISMLVSGLIGLYDESCTSPDILSRIKSFIPRNIRRNIIEFISQKGIQAFNFDPIAMQMALITLDNYIAHAFCLDLKSSLAAIVRRNNPDIQLSPTPSQWILSYTSIPQIQMLLEFNISERYSELRQKLGIFIKMSEET